MTSTMDVLIDYAVDLFERRGTNVGYWHHRSVATGDVCRFALGWNDANWSLIRYDAVELAAKATILIDNVDWWLLIGDDDVLLVRRDKDGSEELVMSAEVCDPALFDRIDQMMAVAPVGGIVSRCLNVAAVTARGCIKRCNRYITRAVARAAKCLSSVMQGPRPGAR